MQDPFLCVITPIFDGAFEALKLLIETLKTQTMRNFIHVAISAGPSKQSQQFIESLNDHRFIYKEHTALKTKNFEELVASLGDRRTYCFKSYKAHRYVCLDADLKIISDDYFRKLYGHHDDANVLITQIWWPKKDHTLLPKYPITRGRIDLANFSFSRRVVEDPNCSYPTDMGLLGGRDGDWRFFEIISTYGYKVISITSAIYNGNSTYTSVSDSV